jgi:hypothetical protein
MVIGVIGAMVIGGGVAVVIGAGAAIGAGVTTGGIATGVGATAGKEADPAAIGGQGYLVLPAVTDFGACAREGVAARAVTAGPPALAALWHVILADSIS